MKSFVAKNPFFLIPNKYQFVKLRICNIGIFSGKPSNGDARSRKKVVHTSSSETPSQTWCLSHDFAKADRSRHFVDFKNKDAPLYNNPIALLKKLSETKK